MPVMRVIDRKMIEKAMPCEKGNTQLSGSQVSEDTMKPANSTRQPHLVGRSSRRSRIWMAGGGSGGSTEANGSVLLSRSRSFGLARSTITSTAKGRAGATPVCSTLPDGSTQTRRFWAMPSTMDHMSALGMLLKLARAAAVRPVTSRVVKLMTWVGSRVWLCGSMSTPARPARALDSPQAVAATAAEFTPSSWARRLLSTTARICRPMLLQRNSATRASTTTTVITVVAMVVPSSGVWYRVA